MVPASDWDSQRSTALSFAERLVAFFESSTEQICILKNHRLASESGGNVPVTEMHIRCLKSRMHC